MSLIWPQYLTLRAESRYCLAIMWIWMTSSGWAHSQQLQRRVRRWGFHTQNLSGSWESFCRMRRRRGEKSTSSLRTGTITRFCFILCLDCLLHHSRRMLHWNLLRQLLTLESLRSRVNLRRSTRHVILGMQCTSLQ